MNDHEKMQALGKFLLNLTRPLDSGSIIAANAWEIADLLRRGKQLRLAIRRGVSILQELPCFEDLLLAAMPSAKIYGDLDISFHEGNWRLTVFSPPRGKLYHLALREAVAQFVVNYNRLTLARFHLMVEKLRSSPTPFGGQECK